MPVVDGALVDVEVGVVVVVVVVVVCVAKIIIPKNHPYTDYFITILPYTQNRRH